METSTDPEQQAALLAAVQVAIDNILTPLVIASFISCALLGIVISLGLSYFVRFPNDRVAYKILVSVLLCGCITDTAITTSWVYDFTITYFGQPQMFAYWPWQFSGYAGITGPMVLVAQSFYIYRLFVTSGKAWIFPGLTFAVALAATAACFYIFSFALRAELLSQFNDVAAVCWTWLGLELAVDIFITGGMVWYLLIRPARIGGSEAVYSSSLMRIVVMTVETNTASLILQALVVILIGFSLKRGSLHYCIPGFLERVFLSSASKGYSLSVIATLLARKSGHELHDSNVRASEAGGIARSKGLGARLFNKGSTRGGLPTNSVHVQVEHEVAVDHHREMLRQDEGGAGQYGGMSPVPLGKYTVQFDIEDGRSESEKGARYQTR
ncbi:hypothetical protein JCM11251_004713 [Rhodosporidiobolus azoricus]